MAGLFKKNSKHAVHLYLIGLGVWLLALARSQAGDPTGAHRWLRLFCDASSICAVLYYLLAFYYRPAKSGFWQVTGYYLRRVLGRTGKNEQQIRVDQETEEKVTNNFLDAMFLGNVSTLLTVIGLLLYGLNLF